MSVLELANVSVRANKKTLLKNVSVNVREGEVLAIIGPNGAGKSTLLKAIAGDVRLSEGEITYRQKTLANWQAQNRARHIAFLPQLSLLNFPFTVAEVVSLGRIPHATGLAVDNDIVYQAMSAMDLLHLADSVYTQLSGGEKQRTQLARVLAQIWRREDADFRLLMLDEPSAALDLGHQQQLMRAITEFAKQGVAVLIVAHDVNIAARYAHSMLALKGGRLLACASAGKILDKGLLQTLYDADLRVVEHADSKKTVVVHA